MEFPPCAALSARETLGVMDTSDVQLPPYPQGGNHTFFFVFVVCVLGLSFSYIFFTWHKSCFLVLVNVLIFYAYYYVLWMIQVYFGILCVYCFSQLKSVNGFGFRK